MNTRFEATVEHNASGVTEVGAADPTGFPSSATNLLALDKYMPNCQFLEV